LGSNPIKNKCITLAEAHKFRIYNQIKINLQNVFLAIYGNTMEGRREWTEGWRGRGRPRQKLIDWMMDTGNSRKRHNIEKSGVVGHLDLSESR